MNLLPPKTLVKTWLFLATRADFYEAQSVAKENIEQTFKTMMEAIEYAEN